MGVPELIQMTEALYFESLPLNMAAFELASIELADATIDQHGHLEVRLRSMRSFQSKGTTVYLSRGFSFSVSLSASQHGARSSSAAGLGRLAVYTERPGPRESCRDAVVSSRREDVVSTHNDNETPMPVGASVALTHSLARWTDPASSPLHVFESTTHQSVKQTQAAMTSARIVLLRIFLRRICATIALMPANEWETLCTFECELVKRARWLSSEFFVSSAWLARVGDSASQFRSYTPRAPNEGTYSMMLLAIDRDESSARRSFSSASISTSSDAPFGRLRA